MKIVSYPPYTKPPQTVNEPQGRDTFETPNYATDLLVPYIPKNIHSIWECACGGGKIKKRLESYGYKVFATDIRYIDGITTAERNFLDSDPSEWEMDSGYIPDGAIVTNPPYSIKELFIERALKLNVPFAFLISATYSGKSIEWIRKGCEKIIPTRRIDYITPTGRHGKMSSSQFHTMWLTYKFNIGKTETFVELPIEWKKERI